LTSDLLRGFRLEKLAPESVNYTSSTEYDRILVEQVIKINMAHITMLALQDIIDRNHYIPCLEGLKKIPLNFKLDPKFEDVHMNLETYLSKKIGDEAAGQLNLGKSRNDQVSTAIRMVLREYILNILSSLYNVCKEIIEKSSDHIETLIPGYTHLQHAQPITLGHHLLAHFDALERDIERIIESYSRINRSPLGAAALSTSSINIDRNLTSRILGFNGLIENSIDAVSSRDFVIEVVSDLALIMTDLSRMAEEFVLWSTSEFGFIDISDRYSSTSSIMPQKKNAVVAELIRGKTSSSYGEMIASISIMKSLPFSYNIDMQELTPHLWKSCKTTLESLDVLSGMLKEIRINKERFQQILYDETIFATDLADYLVLVYKIPFRKAHTLVGSLVRISIEEKKSFKEVIRKNIGKISKQITGQKITLTAKRINKIINPLESIRSKKVIGGPSKRSIVNMIKSRRKKMKEVQKWLLKNKSHLEKSDQELKKYVEEIIGGDKI